MLRGAAMIAVVGASTAIGFSFGRDLANRLSGLRELERAADILKAEMQYAGTPLQEIFREMGKRTASPFGDFFTKTADAMDRRNGKTLGKIMEEEAAECLADTGLTKSDRAQLVRLGERLGYLDVQMQMMVIERYKEELKRERKEAEEEYRQKGRVYRCLGFLGGVFLTLLLL